MKIDSEDRLVAVYAASAIALSIAEAAIPSPLPGIKPGLANIIVLIVLFRHGWHVAIWVALLRIFGSSLLLGQFLAPGFFLGLSGTLCSLAVLGASSHLPVRWFGPVSASILAAFAHIAGQLLLVRLWLIPNNGLLYLVPILSVFALCFGFANGLISARLLK